MPVDQRMVLQLAGDGWRQQEIADQLGCTQGRVSQIINAAREASQPAKAPRPSLRAQAPVRDEAGAFRLMLLDGLRKAKRGDPDYAEIAAMLREGLK